MSDKPTIVVDGESDLGPWTVYLAVTTHDWRRCAVITQEPGGYHWEGFHPKRRKEIIEGRTLSSASRAKDAAVNWVQSEIEFLLGSGVEE